MFNRLAIIFDDSTRSDTTGVHVRRALASLIDVMHYQPANLGHIPTAGFDFYLSIDDDSEYELPDLLRPSVYWAIDTHRDFAARLDRARRADLVFVAQRDGAERLQQAGIKSAVWLPLACDPSVHRRLEIPKRFDVSFVGNVFPGLRCEMLRLLKRHWPTSFVGKAYGQAMAEIYSASRCTFNRSLADDVNMRVFEATACGSLLITNNLAHNGQEELLRSGEHIITYDDSGELLEKVKYYLGRENEREHIAAAGRAEALARHTYRHRMETLLAEAERRLGKASSAGIDLGIERKALGDTGGGALSSSLAAYSPGASTNRGFASIVLPCYNQLEYTRECLRALIRYTRAPYELVIIDDGSTDGTAAYLAGVADVAPIPVTLVSNGDNLGFPASVNRGLRAARGDFLVLLNNDVVVTDGWLEQLIALVEISSPGVDRIGLVGPMSNYASPPQLLEEVPYRDMDSMHAFARRWRDEHRGQWFTAGKVSGFCMLMKRAVFEAVGGLDEGFGLGFFDDDDLAERARRAGFACAVARDLFVHHFGSRTFVGQGIDAEKLLAENGRRYAEKWGLPEGRRVELRSWSTDERLPKQARPKVSLTMIVRDEEANLVACLDSVAGLFDEVVVVDTGSRDRTREIACGMGAGVFEFPWIDDFAAARNAALERATGDYAFWLDADDVVEPHERVKLESLLSGLRAGEQTAYVVRCACDPDGEGGGGHTVVDHIRLFPLRGDVRWTYRVHEQILPSLRRAGVPVRWSEVTVRHTGYSDAELRRRKLERDERILHQELAARPDDPFVLFNLGSIAVERCDWNTGLQHLGRSLAGSAPSDSITRKLFALIARCRQMLGDLEGAAAVCDEGLGTVPDDAELLFRKAVALRGLSRHAEAEVAWRRILTLRRPEEFSSVDSGVYGHLTRRNLAVLAEERGALREAADIWLAILAECPADPEAAYAIHRLAGPIAAEHVPWLIQGSSRYVIPYAGQGDFDPYMRTAYDWVLKLRACVVVELGVRQGASTRALLEGVRQTQGTLWGVDLNDGHGIVDPRFHFIKGDAAHCVDRWESIDLLHVDTDPHTEEQTLRWFNLYASKCRAIALHDAHHPAFGVGRAVRKFLSQGGWAAHEYWGNPSGWTVLTRSSL